MPLQRCGCHYAAADTLPDYFQPLMCRQPLRLMPQHQGLSAGRRGCQSFLGHKISATLPSPKASINIDAAPCTPPPAIDGAAWPAGRCRRQDADFCMYKGVSSPNIFTPAKRHDADADAITPMPC